MWQSESDVSERNERLKIVLCGACLSGNMGGQALYLSMVESLEGLADVEITVLSKYPKDDRPHSEELGWLLVPFPTRTQLFVAASAGLLSLLKFPRRWITERLLPFMEERDIVIDLSGISFSDYRDFTGLIINCLWLIPAIVTGTPYVKASQAMGPFTKPQVRKAARYFLSRAAGLVARGAVTAKYLHELLPDSVIYELPDIAFALEPARSGQVLEILVSMGLKPDEPFCVMGPSHGVNAMMAKTGDRYSYVRLMARIAEKLILLSGHSVLLVPHERSHSGSTADDMNVCRSIFNAVDSRERLRIVEKDLSAKMLKGIIARADVAIGSRFHFMVAAMSSAVPGITIGWSHKYFEMMGMVGQSRFVLDFSGVTEEEALSRVQELWETRGIVRHEIEMRLADIMEKARANAEIVLGLVRDRRMGRCQLDTRPV
jgi:colanic acid/amylovoran biosynthesis protein